MIIINENLTKEGYKCSFSNVNKEVKEFREKYPQTKLFNLGIGDVSLPIIPPVLKAMTKAVKDLGSMDTFKGYGYYYGYDFLKTAIIDHDYKNLNISFDEVYVSNGAKSDTSNILNLFSNKASVLLMNPMYPVYFNSIVINGNPVDFLDLKEEKGFIPEIPNKKYDIIFICNPNNPLGITLNKEELEKWVNYALKNKSIIIYDNVYEPFLPKNEIHSIYEIPNANKVAIEFRSYSKKISFTGVRCSYYILPNTLILDKKYKKCWNERILNTFNGADYIAQRGAEASYTEKAEKLINKNINYYLENAHFLKKELIKMDFKVFGGESSPYLWVKTKNNYKSWDYFIFLLNNLNIIMIPGIIFGENGDNYMRISALGNRKDVEGAIKRLKEYYK